MFDIKFWFSKKHIFLKQKKLAVCGHVSLVLDFKLTQENDDLLSLRHEYMLRYHTLVIKDNEMRISDKRYQNSTVRTF